jgi:hypothetical protein
MSERDLLVALALIEMTSGVAVVDTLIALGRQDIVDEATSLAEIAGEEEDEEDDDDPELEDPEPDQELPDADLDDAEAAANPNGVDLLAPANEASDKS